MKQDNPGFCLFRVYIDPDFKCEKLYQGLLFESWSVEKESRDEVTLFHSIFFHCGPSKKFRKSVLDISSTLSLLKVIIKIH